MVEGRTIVFKCIAEAAKHTLTLTGTVQDDEIAFSWKLEVQPGGIPPAPTNELFGASAPPQFIAKRVEDGEFPELVQLAGGVRTIEVVAAVNLLDKNAKARGTLLVSQTREAVRAAIVVNSRALGGLFYDNEELQKFATSSKYALLIASVETITNPVRITANVEAFDFLLGKLAEESGHPELTRVPLLFWGHSAGGGLGGAFAVRYPERTVALVSYHGPMNANEEVLGIPVLLMAGGKDGNRDRVEGSWRAARAAGAKWTFALEPDAVHFDRRDLEKASPFILSWIASVLRARVSGQAGLRAIDAAGVWFGNPKTGEIVPAHSTRGSPQELVWLPDEATALAWRAVSGFGN
jgi:hypothetical protein